MSWNYDAWLQSSLDYEEFIGYKDDENDEPIERDKYEEFKDTHFEEWEKMRGYR